VSAAEVALAWVRQQKGVTSTIIGAKTPEQLTSNLHSASLHLTEAELKELDEVSKPARIYPGWMVERQMSDRYPKEK
jgi:aryl-alcohol dehydrogenase-like predicted oxidoreductase